MKDIEDLKQKMSNLESKLTEVSHSNLPQPGLSHFVTNAITAEDMKPLSNLITNFRLDNINNLLFCFSSRGIIS